MSSKKDNGVTLPRDVFEIVLGAIDSLHGLEVTEGLQNAKGTERLLNRLMKMSDEQTGVRYEWDPDMGYGVIRMKDENE